MVWTKTRKDVIINPSCHLKDKAKETVQVVTDNRHHYLQQKPFIHFVSYVYYLAKSQNKAKFYTLCYCYWYFFTGCITLNIRK